MISQIKYKIARMIIRYYFLKSGPHMFDMGSYWIFLDEWGSIYKVTSNQDQVVPLSITLLERN